MRKIAYFMIALMVLIPLLAACGRTQEKYQINPAKISGDTAEQRLESLRGLLNKKTDGFSRLSNFAYENEEKIVRDYLMVYSDEKVMTVKVEENAVTIIVSENLSMVIGQIFAYTANFVSSDLEYVLLYVVDMEGNNVGFSLSKSGLEKFKTSPPEKWKEFLERTIWFNVQPAVEVSVE